MPLNSQIKQNCIVTTLDSSAPANLAIWQQLLMEMSRQWGCTGAPALSAILSVAVVVQQMSKSTSQTPVAVETSWEGLYTRPSSSNCVGVIAIKSCCFFCSDPELVPAGFPSEPEVLLELTDLQRTWDSGLSKHGDCPGLGTGSWSSCNLCLPPFPLEQEQLSTLMY